MLEMLNVECFFSSVSGLYEPPVNRYLTAQMTSATNSEAVRARRIV